MRINGHTIEGSALEWAEHIRIRLLRKGGSKKREIKRWVREQCLDELAPWDRDATADGLVEKALRKGKKKGLLLKQAGRWRGNNF